MSEEIKNQEQQGTEVNEPNNEPSTDNNIDVAAQIEEMKKKLEAELSEQFKKEISGLNRKNSELQNILKEKDMEDKTEAEKKEMLQKELEELQGEIKDTNRGRIVDQELYNAGLPLEFAKRIIGEDEANIKEDISNIKAYIDGLVQAGVEKTINEKMAGKAPEGGTNPASISIDDQIKKAQEAKDFALVMHLRDEKRKQNSQ